VRTASSIVADSCQHSFVLQQRNVRYPAYPAEIERVIRIDVKAWDLNCRRHLPKLVPQQHVDRMISDCDARVASLQARYDDLLAIMYAHE
jgi:hypothetical protein